MQKNRLVDDESKNLFLDKIDNVFRKLIKNQFKNKNRKPIGVRYSNAIKEFVLTLNYYSLKSLNYCR